MVADVSATVAMRFTEMLRYESAGRSEPEAILAGVDVALRGQIPVDMFVTCAIGTLHVRDRRLILSSAGSPEICYFASKEGTATDIRLTGFPMAMPLSIRGDKAYQTRTLDLASGDVVVFTNRMVSRMPWIRRTRPTIGSACPRLCECTSTKRCGCDSGRHPG